MNNETTDTTGAPVVSAILNGTSGTVHKVAQKAHEAVDRIEQTVATGTEKVATLQEEYGAHAREHIRAHPLATVAGAFAIGLVIGKILR